MALTQGVKESIWFQALLRDLGAFRHLDEITNINIANQGAMALSRNAEYHSRTKHIDIQYHFIREHVGNRTISLHFCPTSNMTADIFTKALLYPSFIKHSIGLGLIDISAFLLQDTQALADDYDPTGLHASHDYQEMNSGETTGEGWYCESPALTLDFSPPTTPTPERRRC